MTPKDFLKLNGSDGTVLHYVHIFLTPEREEEEFDFDRVLFEMKNYDVILADLVSVTNMGRECVFVGDFYSLEAFLEDVKITIDRNFIKPYAEFSL